MDKGQVEKYWKEVRSRAWDDAVNKSGINLLIIILVVTLLGITLISGLFVLSGLLTYPFFEDNLIANSIAGIVQIIVSIIVFAFLYDRALHEIPPKMHEELGGFIENPFDTIAREPYMKNSGDFRWASIDVINKTALVVSKCYVEMIKVTDSNGNRVVPISQNLKWSKSHGEINRNKELEVYRSPRICDVAVAVPSRNQILFETWAGEYWCDVGVYNITIEIHGLFNNLLRDANYNLTLEYKGGNLISILKEGQEKWKEEQLDPKPPSPQLSQTVKATAKNKKSSPGKISSGRSKKVNRPTQPKASLRKSK